MNKYRQTRVGLVLAGAAIAGLIVFLVVDGTGVRRRPQPTPCGVHPVHTTLTLTGRLVALRACNALASARRDIVRADTIERFRSGAIYAFSAWFDLVIPENYRVANGADGTRESLILDTAQYRQHGEVTTVTIDYRHHEFVRSVVTDPRTAQRSGGAAAASGAPADHVDGGRTLDSQRQLGILDALRDVLARDQNSIVRRVMLDHRTALVLAHHFRGDDEELWIDAKSYLPWRSVAREVDRRSLVTYTWIPRSAQRLSATFAPSVPEGFAQVRRLAGH